MFTFPTTLYSRGSIALSYVTNTSSASDSNTYSFTSQSFGTAAVNRKIIVVISGAAVAGAYTVTGVTIGGVAATIVVQGADGSALHNISAIAIADVPTGATGTVAVTFSNTVVYCAIGIYRMTGASTTGAYDTFTSSASAAVATGSLSVLAGGVVVGVTTGSGSADIAVTWNAGATEDYDIQPDSVSTASSGAHSSFTATQEVTVTATITGTGVGGGQLSAASWYP